MAELSFTELPPTSLLLLPLSIAAAIALPLLYLQYSSNKNSSPVPNWPLVGMLPSLLLHLWRDLLHEFVTGTLEESGGTYFFRGPWFAGLDAVVTADPENVHHILSSNFKNYPKGSELNAILEPMGEGIFNADGESWKYQRETIHSLINTAAFHRVMLKTLHRKLQTGLIPILHAAAAAANLQTNPLPPPPPPLDLQHLMKRLTFDTICSLVMGFDPQYLAVGLPCLPYADAFDVIEQVILYRHCVPAAVWRFQRWARIGEERRMREARECFDRFLRERIGAKKTESSEKKQGKEGETEDDVGDDFLAMILSGKAGVEGELTDEFLRDVVFNLILAGRDTIAVALSWFFWLVASNPGVEEKIVEEMDRVIGKNGYDQKETCLPSTEQLSEMVYLHGAICETLRLYPSVPYEHKQSIEPDVLPSGHAIDCKTKIILSIYSMGRMEQIWGEDWTNFKPERWLSTSFAEDKKTKITTVVRHVPAYKFAAFMAGPRTCLGRKIAFIQMKAVAISVLQRFKIEVVDGHPVVPDPSILMFMKYGLMVRVFDRA